MPAIRGLADEQSLI